METTSPMGAEKKERAANDRDLNAVEAYMLGSTHPEIIDNEGNKPPKEMLEELFKSDRKKALTPQNILTGMSAQQVDEIRTQKPYEDGLLALFGPNYMFGFRHEITFGNLTSEGESTGLDIKLFQGDEPVPTSTLAIDPQFVQFFEAPETAGLSTLLKYKK